MGLPAGTGPNRLLTPSTNMYGMGVSAALMHVGTTTSVLSIPPVDLIVYLLEYPNMPQSPPPRPLLCGIYPPPRIFLLPLSGSMLYSVCGLLGSGGPLSHQSA